jgi:hypothetical protein
VKNAVAAARIGLPSQRAGQSDSETPEDKRGRIDEHQSSTESEMGVDETEVVPTQRECREMQDQEWHEFIQEDRSTFPPDHSSIQVIFASGRLIKGTSRDGMLSHEYKIPETAITRWRYI